MNDEEENDADNDDILDWLVTVYQPDLTDYSCTLQDGQIESISDGETTVYLTT